MKLLIAVPTSGMICWAFGLCMTRLNVHLVTTGRKPGVQVGLASAEGANWIENRENLVERAINNGFTHIAFFDDDMVFDETVLDGMIEHAQSGKHIVLTNYVVKEWPPKTFTAMGLDGQRCHTTEDKHGLEEVIGSGFGVSIINLDVFKKLTQPWFLPTWTRELGYSTEDLPMFRKAREAGFKVYVDHDASKRISHMGRKQWHWKEVS